MKFDKELKRCLTRSTGFESGTLVNGMNECYKLIDMRERREEKRREKIILMERDSQECGPWMRGRE